MRNSSGLDSTFFPKLKMHTNLLSYMLKKKEHIDAIINPTYDPSKIEDGHYLYILINAPNAKDDFSSYIHSLCTEKINIKNVFDKSQIPKISKIAKEIKLEDIKKFFDLEFERLKKEVKPENIREKNIEIKERKRHEVEVDKMIDNPLAINLNLVNFFMLIREYYIATDLLMQSKSSDTEKVEQEQMRLKKISNLICKNQDKVEFFKTLKVENHPKLKQDIIIYMHALCSNGHIKNLEILLKKFLSDENLLSVFKDLSEEGNFNGEVTFNGLLKIIDKRINIEQKDGSPHKDTLRWKEVKDIFLKNKTEILSADFEKWQKKVYDAMVDPTKKSENPNENKDKPRTSFLPRLWRFLAVGAIFHQK